MPWAPPAASAPAAGRAPGTVRADAEAAARRAARAPAITVSLAPVGDVPTRRRRGARRPRVLATIPTRRARRWPPPSRAGARAASPRPRSTSPAWAARPSTPTTGRRRSSARAPSSRRPTCRRSRPRSRAGVPLVMVGHARYPALDADAHRVAVARDRRRPAARAARLPRRRGHRLDGGAGVARDRHDRDASSERAVRAGADLVLLTGRGSYAPVYRHLLARRAAVAGASAAACASRPRACSRSRSAARRPPG